MLQELAEKQPVKDYLPDMCHIQKERGLFAKKYIKVKKIIKKWKEKDACGDGIGVRLPIEWEGWEETCLVISGNS